MKKKLMGFLLTTMMVTSPYAYAASFDFESFQLERSSYNQGDYPSFTVRLSNSYAADNLVLNNNIRGSILSGNNYVPRNESFNMPSNQQILESLRELEYVYETTGLKLYVNDSYNGYQNVSVVNPDGRNVHDLFNLLNSTGVFDVVEYFEFTRPDQDVMVAKPNASGRDKSNGSDVSVMSVINTGAFNDSFYPEQTHFGRQAANSLGSHSFEAAIGLLKNSGVLNGRKINVAVVDSGYFPHEDIEFAETKDFALAPLYQTNLEFYDGYIYLNKNRANLLDHDTTRNNDFSIGCDGYFLNADGSVIDGMEDEAEKCFSNFNNASISTIDPAYLCKSEYGCNLNDWVEFENDGRSILYSDTHGIEVAGLIAAKSNNNKGIAGIIPSENVNLINVASLYDGNGSSTNINLGILWAAGMLEHPDVEPAKYPADVINLSLGGYGLCNQRHDVNRNSDFAPSSAIFEKLYNAGVVVVAAAGNDNLNHFQTSPSSCAFTVSVGALNAAGKLAFFSNHGFDLDVMAHGEGVITTTNTINDRNDERLYTFIPFVDDADSRSAYGAVNGTSFSAPIVSGLVGLLKLADPSLTPKDIFEVINSTATRMDDYGKCSYLGCGNGSINAEKAVRFVLYGEMLDDVEAKHFLAETDFVHNEARISKLAEYGDVCGKYKITNGINVENGNFEYALYGTNDNDSYEPIGVYNSSDFIFDDSHSAYGLVVKNNSNGSTSDMTRVNIDRGFNPSICQ